MFIVITVYQCDIEDVKNREIMDILKDELRTVGKYYVDDITARYHHELHFFPKFKTREAYKVLKMVRIAHERFYKNDEYVCVYARVNF